MDAPLVALDEWIKQHATRELREICQDEVFGEIHLQGVQLVYFSLICREWNGGVIIDIKFYEDLNMVNETDRLHGVNMAWAPSPDRLTSVWPVDGCFVSLTTPSWESFRRCSLQIFPAGRLPVLSPEIRVFDQAA